MSVTCAGVVHVGACIAYPANRLNLEPTCPMCERYAGAVTFHNIVVEFPVFRNDLYIKGYKVDREKLLNNFTPRASDPENLRMLDIWEKFPTEFLYLAMGNEPDGRISLVIVLSEPLRDTTKKSFIREGEAERHVMYKCHIGSCTPRRTIMESKKKKKRQRKAGEGIDGGSLQ